MWTCVGTIRIQHWQLDFNRCGIYSLKSVKSKDWPTCSLTWTLPDKCHAVFLLSAPCMVDWPLTVKDQQAIPAPPSDSWLKGFEFESRQEQQGNFLLQSWLSVQTLIRCLFHPRVTAMVRKRSLSFCQKCSWVVTPKHAYTLHQTKSEWADYAAVQE